MSRSTSEHVHIGDPCVCELQEIFIALSVASANNEREAISSTPLRNALIKLDPDSNYFQEVSLHFGWLLPSYFDTPFPMSQIH